MSGAQAPRHVYTGIGFVDKLVGYFDPANRVCKLPGCNKQCYVENDGYVHDFCGRSHALEYRAKKDEAERQKALLKQQKARGQHGNGVGHHTGHGGGCQCMSGNHPGAGGAYGMNVVHQGFMQPSNVGPGSAVSMVNQPANFIVVNQPGHFDPPPIRFYNRDDPYYEFTNFYPAEILLDGKRWPTTEHYFQAQKFIGTPYTEMIRNFDRPREAFDLSRNPAVSRWCRRDWDKVKIEVMRKALLAKFTQHKDLRNLLLCTGDNMLIEHSPYDKFWGNGGDDSGENHLGMLLMEIRYELFQSLRNNIDSVDDTKQHPSPKVYREALQKSRDAESGSASQNDSSSMDYSDPETNKDGVNQQRSQVEVHRPLEQQVVDENGSNSAGAELRSHSGSPAHIGAGEGHAAPDGEVEVGNLIDLNEAGPEMTKTDSLLMAENSTGIPPPKIQPVPATSTLSPPEAAAETIQVVDPQTITRDMEDVENVTDIQPSETQSTPATSTLSPPEAAGQVADPQTMTGDTEDMETASTGDVTLTGSTVVPDEPTQTVVGHQQDTAGDNNDVDTQGEEENMEINDIMH